MLEYFISVFFCIFIVFLMMQCIKRISEIINPKPTARLSLEQRRAEKEAVQKLKQAQQLIKESDSNFEAARRIREDVVNRILPKNKLYIIGKHPQSLLKDVDRQIQKAHFRRLGTHLSDAEAEVSLQSASSVLLTPTSPTVALYDKRSKEREKRYATAAQRTQYAQFGYVVVLLILTTLLAIAIFVIAQLSDPNQYKHSFDWLNQ